MNVGAHQGRRKGRAAGLVCPRSSRRARRNGGRFHTQSLRAPDPSPTGRNIDSSRGRTRTSTCTCSRKAAQKRRRQERDRRGDHRAGRRRGVWLRHQVRFCRGCNHRRPTITRTAGSGDSLPPVQGIAPPRRQRCPGGNNIAVGWLLTCPERHWLQREQQEGEDLRPGQQSITAAQAAAVLASRDITGGPT